jgi:hypothetical protein
MNIVAMAVVTLVIFAEKTLPWGRLVSRVTAAALVAYGVVVLGAPQVLPTFMADGGTAMTAPAEPMDMKNMPMRESVAAPVKQ